MAAIGSEPHAVVEYRNRTRPTPLVRDALCRNVAKKGIFVKIVHIGAFKVEAANGVNAIVKHLAVAQAGLAGTKAEVWHPTSSVGSPTLVETSQNVEFWKIPTFRPRWLAGLAFPRATRRWIEARMRDVDCLHLHSVFIPHLHLFARLGIPYVFTPNGGLSPIVLRGKNLANRLGKRIWIALFDKHVWRHARFIQAVSPDEYRELTTLMRLAGVTTPVRLVPNGVAVPSQGSSFAEEKWLFVGRFARQKGLDMLLRAYALANRTCSLPKLVLAGVDTEDLLAGLESLCHDLTLDGRVEWIPGGVYGPAKDRLFRSASAFIHTSRWEGLPIALLEAASYGLPLLVTHEANMDAFVGECHCGLCVDLDVTRISEGLLALAAMSLEEKQAMGLRGRYHAQAHYSWASIAGRLVELVGPSR